MTQRPGFFAGFKGGWSRAGFNTAEVRDKEYKRYKERGFRMGKRWSEKHWERTSREITYYFFSYRLPRRRS